jgi:hypothetical protein
MKRISILTLIFIVVISVKSFAGPTISGGGGTGSGSANVATDTIFDAAGDLIQGSGANAGERLAVGTAYQVLHSNGTKAAWTSTLGATGTRLTYGYFIDLVVTNAIQGSITGNAGGLTGTPNITVGTISAGATGFSVDADGDTTAKSITVTKSSGVAGLMSVYEANSTDTSYIGFMGPASISESYSFQFSSTQPAAGQVMAFAAPTGTGDPNGNKVSAQTWVTPVLKSDVVKLAVFNFSGDSADNTVIDSYQPFAGTITGWVITNSGAACSAVVDIWAQAYADFPPENAQSIAASALPTLSTAQMNKDTTLTGWTKAVAADSFLRANLDSSDCTGTIQVTIYGTR